MSYEDRDTSSSDQGNGPGPAVMGASTLTGNDVYNRKQENLGNIKEIMLDMHSGSVAYAVLSCGGFLGMGDRLFAVPWNALTLDTVNQCFLLNMDADRLKNAPGFNKDEWPNMADPTWEKSVHTYYGTPLAITKPNIPHG